MTVQLSADDFLQAADHEVRMRRWRAESEGEFSVHELTIPLEVDADILRWYLLTYTPDSYLLWHPSHLAHVREAGQPEQGRRFVVWEWINGRLQADRMWGGAPLELCPVAPDDPERAVLTAVLDTDGEPFRHILVEVEADGSGGVVSRGRWTFPGATPQDYIDGLLAHCREERIGMVERAIPYALKRHFGFTPTTDQVLAELGAVAR
jgi:hypothetical protein